MSRVHTNFTRNLFWTEGAWASTWMAFFIHKKQLCHHTQIVPLDQESKNNMTFKFACEIWKKISRPLFLNKFLFLCLNFFFCEKFCVSRFQQWWLVGWLCVWFGVQEKVHDVPPRHYYIWSSLSNKTLLIAQSVRTKELAKKVSLHRFSLFLPFCVCVCVSRFSFSFFFKLWKWCQKHGGGFEPRRPNNFDQTTTNATHTHKNTSCNEWNDGEKLHLLWKALKRKLTSQTIQKQMGKTNKHLSTRTHTK